jgi:hypothetical protein
MNRAEYNTKIKLVRVALIETLAKHASGRLKDMQDLYISDHLAQRMVDRNLATEVPFVIGMALAFMVNEFYESTYSERKYVVQLKDLKVGIAVHVGKLSNRRFATINTAFTSQETYECDQLIQLK